jgi:hypothetical protein
MASVVLFAIDSVVVRGTNCKRSAGAIEAHACTGLVASILAVDIVAGELIPGIIKVLKHTHVTRRVAVGAVVCRCTNRNNGAVIADSHAGPERIIRVLTLECGAARTPGA